MQKPENIIEAVFDDRTTEARTIMAETLGKEQIPSPAYYRNTKTGALYSCLAGGIAWPGRVKEKGDNFPGLAVVVCAEKTDHGEPAFHVLEEIEEVLVERLIAQCVRIRHKYGFKKDEEILSGWYGDSTQYRHVVSDVNRFLQKNDEGLFHVRGMPDLAKPEDFNLFARCIDSMLMPDHTGRKRLFFDSCHKTRNRILNPMQDGGVGIKALGYVLHALLCLRQWEVSVNSEPVCYIKF